MAFGEINLDVVDSFEIVPAGSVRQDQGKQFYISRQDWYYDSKIGKPRHTVANDFIIFYLLVGEHLTRIGLCREYQVEEFKERIKNMPHFEDFYSKTLDHINNPEAYNQGCIQNKAARDAEDAKRKAQAEERERAQKAKEEEIYQKAKQDYIDGQMVDWEHFERLCKENGVEIHMRTLGSCRKRVYEVNSGRSIRFTGQSNSLLYSLSAIIRDLNDRLGLTK